MKKTQELIIASNKINSTYFPNMENFIDEELLKMTNAGLYDCEFEYEVCSEADMEFATDIAKDVAHLYKLVMQEILWLRNNAMASQIPTITAINVRADKCFNYMKGILIENGFNKFKISYKDGAGFKHYTSDVPIFYLPIINVKINLLEDSI